MVKKGPRRTAERILETTLALFNRFGEPNVSTTLIASELGISPGNLYYHYPAKEVLVSRLYDRFELSVLELLHAAEEVQDVEAAWFFLHALFERIWEYRFLYRDLNDLLSRIRHLETQVRQLLLHKTRALRLMLDAMRRAGTLQIEGSAADSLAATMVVVLTYWFSYVYALSPRTALEEEQSTYAPLQGARHVLGMLLPQLAPEARAHFLSLVDAYGEPVR